MWYTIIEFAYFLWGGFLNAKRILAVILLIVLTVIPITAVSAHTSDGLAPVSADSGYSPRLTAPSSSNKYYYSNLNIFYSIGYGMPNCTAYAWGRAYELLGSRPNLSLDSAKYWWDYNKQNNYYPYGSTPKLGAIACWNYSSGGHVAVVEKITSTTITLSNSAFGGKNFYLTETAVGASNGGVYDSSWRFMGYIYILDAVNNTTAQNGDIYRIDSPNGVNLRSGAGTSYSVLNAVPYQTEIAVTATKSIDGYLWGKTTFDGKTGWCVLDYATLVSKKPTAATEPAVNPDEPGSIPTEATMTETATDSVETTTAVSTETPTASVENTTVPILSFPAFTDATEVYPSEAKPLLSADVDRDGKTTITDATAIQKFVAGMTPKSFDEGVADADGDGKITVSDATYIQKVLAFLI